jgi:hypothetical protein
VHIGTVEYCLSIFDTKALFLALLEYFPTPFFNYSVQNQAPVLLEAKDVLAKTTDVSMKTAFQSKMIPRKGRVAALSFLGRMT